MSSGPSRISCSKTRSGAPAISWSWREESSVGVGCSIPPAAFREADWSTHRFHVALTLDKIKNSPGVDTDKPVSRQHDREYVRYYGFTDPPSPRPRDSSADTHLRSFIEVCGYEMAPSRALARGHQGRPAVGPCRAGQPRVRSASLRLLRAPGVLGRCDRERAGLGQAPDAASADGPPSAAWRARLATDAGRRARTDPRG